MAFQPIRKKAYENRPGVKVLDEIRDDAVVLSQSIVKGLEMPWSNWSRPFSLGQIRLPGVPKKVYRFGHPLQ